MGDGGLHGAERGNPKLKRLFRNPGGSCLADGPWETLSRSMEKVPQASRQRTVAQELNAASGRA